MIFINSAIRQFGEIALIINYKAKEFYKGKKLGKEDFDRFFTLFAENELPILTNQHKNNLLLTICYFDSDYNQKALNYYYNFFKVDPYQKVSGGPQKLILYFLYNLIEFEIKKRFRNDQELKQFYNALNSLSSIQKTIEEYLLMNYYFGVLKYFLKQYEEALVISTNIIIDIDEQIKKNKLLQSDIIKYIQIRNILLRIKSYEESNIIGKEKEIVSNIESLFELCKEEKEDVAIDLGIKMIQYLKTGFETKNCIETLENLNSILHKEMLHGKSHSNIINEFIYISSLLSYYNSLNENFEQVKRFSHKIDKNISFLREFSQSNSVKDLPQFEFINILFKKICGLLNNNLSNEQIQHLEQFKTMVGNNINNMDNIILNLYILSNGNDFIAKNLYKNHEDFYFEIISNEKSLRGDIILNCYVYLYNHISFLTQQIVQSKSKNLLKEMRNYAKQIIDYTLKAISSNIYLTDIFRIIYFKDIFNRIYFSYIYSFYLDGDYEETIKEYNNYHDLVKIQFELSTNSKSYYDILKIKGDCYFKLRQYKDASQVFISIIPLYKENGLSIFNLGLCYIFLGDNKNAITQLNNAYLYFEEKNDKKKMSLIKSVLNSLN